MPEIPLFDPHALPGEVTLDHFSPAQPATFAPLPADLAPELVGALRQRGIDRLFSHQAESYAAARSGGHVVVVTPTASGKTLCYNLPVLQRLLEQPSSRALYLFPTKALAQDQLTELAGLATGLPIDLKVDVYDGDTPPGRRTLIRDGGHVVLTNPDMLHSGVLPHHTKWRRLFSSLDYIVIDELHSYRGLFGSQVANVLRRLRRICAFYGSSPTFICTSATIANPDQLASRLLETEHVRLVDRSGAPRGERRLVFYNPPLVDRDLGVRRSSILEARRIASPWIRDAMQTILFCRSRLQVEVMLSYLQESLHPRLDARRRVRGYRSGYLPLRRREIESGLRSGEVWGVVSTNALELGIDIGSLQAAIMVGYPGSISSTWQQLGRAGRRSGSVAVFVASNAPLDQFIVRHPEYFLGANPEAGLIDPDNVLVLAGHLQAGLFELPFEGGERLGEAEVAELLELFEEDGVANRSGGRWFWSSDGFPAEGVSLRRLAADNVVIVDTSQPRPEVIGEMDQFSAPVFLHEEAIYLQDGSQFHVDRLDWDQKKAYVRPVDVDYYTDAEMAVNVRVLDTFDHAPGGALDRAHGEVKLTSLASVFKKVRFHTHENLGSGLIHLPEQTLHTTAYWTSLDPDVWSGLSAVAAGTGKSGGARPGSAPGSPGGTAVRPANGTAAAHATDRGPLEAGLHGMAHALRAVASLHLMCDPRDLGAIGEVRSPATRRPTVTVYEAYPGGVGYAARLFELHDRMLADAAALVRECPCADGCPSCTGPTTVEGAKERCLRLLSANASPA
jgi:DEAD/DEAH box helicase domain-containing protein